jgi:hypothetical protein
MRSGSWWWCAAALQMAGIATVVADAEGMQPLRVALVDGCTLEVDVRRDETPACWRLHCVGTPPRDLACDVTAMHQVVDFQLSPDQQHLAVLTVGEGHPVLEILPLQPLIENGRYDAGCTLNPYPGSIWMQQWHQSQLQVGSDVDLAEASYALRAEDMTDRDYRISPTLCLQTLPTAAPATP